MIVNSHRLMNRYQIRALVTLVLVSSSLATLAAAAEDEGQRGPAAKTEFFVQEVLPVLRDHCYECHSHDAGEANGQLMVDSLASMLSGGTRGPAVVPGQLQQSPLWTALSHADTDLQMPPSEKLADAQIAKIETWILEGAHVPEAMRGEAVAKSGVSEHAAATHWAYQPPQRWVPSEDSTPAAAAIDQIVRRELTKHQLSLSPRASRATLLRRLSYDLIGLPPTLPQVLEFVEDPRSDDVVVAELIDGLLSSPHFGERWARYWMDVARYADNKGYVFQEDREYPGAYQYRDWLIDAFNQDMPYDEFVTQQLAADLLAAPDRQADLPALGFLTLGRRFLNNKFDIIDDRLDVVSRGLMGMTLTCARCHDHKYDPITQADYYSLAGVFLNTDEPGGEPWPHRLQDASEKRPAFILIRGSPGNRGERVEPRFVSFLAPEAGPFVDGSGRLEMAEQIASADNPLTARVMANRVWMHLTGSSLVESPSDLGTRCPPPVQLALLDHLATSLIDQGWSTKSLIREIVSSQVYQQQSLDRAEAAQVDPENALYWKMNRRRLDFESFRDTLLARAKLLDPTIHGPSAKLDGGPLMTRRAVYAYIDRQNLPSVFRTFDFASPDAHNSGRSLTSVPQQGLFVLNSNFMAEISESLGQQAQQAAGTGEVEAKIAWLFATVLGREPAAEELQLCREFFGSAKPMAEDAIDERWIYGYGAFDPEHKLLNSFERLPTFAGDRWQGGSQLPDARLGWCLLTAEGGHAGNDLAHAVVRRWIAPRDGLISAGGKLKHATDQGDGVRGTILVDNHSQGTWQVKNEEQTAAVGRVAVKAGDAVDFVTDCVGNHSHDSFTWSVRVRYLDAARESFAAKEQVPQPRKEPLDAWAQLAQALLATNELAHVD